jgi:hypothetical protein
LGGKNERDRKRVADETAWRCYSALAADIRRSQAWGREHTVSCGAERAIGRFRLGAAESAACGGSSGRSASAGLPGIPVPRITVSERFALAASAGRPNSFLTTGTINPGVIWVGSYFQVGLEAQLPVNGASGHGVGVLGQLHLYLDDIFPTTIGRPLLGGTSTPPRQLTF